MLAGVGARSSPRSGEGRKTLAHPIAGRLVFEHAVFNPQDAPEQRVILYSPADECGTREKLAELLSGRVLVAA